MTYKGRKHLTSTNIALTQIERLRETLSGSYPKQLELFTGYAQPGDKLSTSYAQGVDKLGKK